MKKMSSTASCEVCGAPALARVGGVQFCARCALQVGTDAPIPRRRAGSRRARLVAGLGAGLVLAVGGIAAAAYWANAPSGPITQTEPIVAEGSAGTAAAPEVLHANRLSAAAADYAESVATWALCVAESFRSGAGTGPRPRVLRGAATGPTRPQRIRGALAVGAGHGNVAPSEVRG